MKLERRARKSAAISFRNVVHPNSVLPGRCDETKTPSSHVKTEWRHHYESRARRAHEAGLILLFDGEVGPPAKANEPWRAQLNRYPDLEPDLTPAFPIRWAKQWLVRDGVAVGVRISLQWRNRPGFSPGSLTLSCDW